MKSQAAGSESAKTTAYRRTLRFGFVLILIVVTACGSRPKVEAEAEAEAESRTEFTDRIENFFEYDPLKAGKPSQFLIHLTDLSDGTPVEAADVALAVRVRGGAEVAHIKARVGKVKGIYVADVAIPSPGAYDIEFHIKNSKIDERMALSDFKVE